MPDRTQLVCLCEGAKGRSIDSVFIHRLIKSLDPSWLRPWTGSNKIRIESCGGRTELLNKFPAELRNCLTAGGDTTLLVCADVDHDHAGGNSLKDRFWETAHASGINRADFDKVVFAFAKDRLENWIEFLSTGYTDESREGPRVKQDREVAVAAKNLAEMCRKTQSVAGMPESLQWSCRNWHDFKNRFR